MLLKSTRDDKTTLPALKAVLKGISDEGGLFIPTVFPTISLDDIFKMKDDTYCELSAKILHMFFDEISIEKMTMLTRDAYRSFSDKSVVPLKKLSDREHIIELFHGPTLAFKDVALQILPRLMVKALDQSASEKDVLILTATSGDTGKAALEGFKDVDRVKIVVFYPSQGVSAMQKRQMCTQAGENVAVFAVKGNFDDTQNGVKAIFTDEAMKQQIGDIGYRLSSANSINIGRLTPQIVYYFSSYIKMLNRGDIALGDKINIVVPTGNFGNILAAYYAQKMGLPVNKFICASNTNRVLTDFFKKREYRLKNREFVKTISPSMDILISSNLERLIADMVADSDVVKKLFSDLSDKGKYDISKHIDQSKTDAFYANWACEKRTKNTIRETYENFGYLIDPHTAVAKRVSDDYYMETGDKTPCIIASTASPYKFSDSVLDALGYDTCDDAFENAQKLSEITGTPIPEKISELQSKVILHKSIIEKDEMFRSIVSSSKK
jgi:threonine synthase